VLVREQNGIHTIDPVRDQLKAKFRRRVDEQSRSAVGLDESPYSAALVARIGRPAHGAAAADLRHSEARAGAEEGELHDGLTGARYSALRSSSGVASHDLHFEQVGRTGNSEWMSSGKDHPVASGSEAQL